MGGDVSSPPGVLGEAVATSLARSRSGRVERAGRLCRELTPLRRVALSVAEQIGDDLAHTLPALCRDPLQPFGVLTADIDDDRQSRVWVAVVGFYIYGVNRRQIGVEVAGLRIGVCPRFLGHDATL